MKHKVESGEFNRNLWFELSEGMIEIPPLRDCPENIEWLAKKLLEHFCIKHNRPKLIITSDAIMVLKAFAWPGNVMQLNSVLVRKAAKCETGVIDADDFLDLIEVDEERSGETKCDRFIRILRSSPSVAIAAKRLGKSVRTIYNWMKAHGVNSKFKQIFAGCQIFFGISTLNPFLTHYKSGFNFFS